MTSLDDVRAARARRDATVGPAEAEFRATCLDALKNSPVTWVAEAAGVSRDTLYAWRKQATDTQEKQ